MRAVVTRVTSASVAVDGAAVGAIGPGLLVLLGIGPDDGVATADRLADRVLGLRIFADERGRFDRSVIDTGGSVLVVSQFTLYADTTKGRRPAFTGAAPPAIAAPLVDAFAARLADRVPVQTGRFGAHMAVSSVNDGPVTLWLEQT
jgi:D-tyrosyl-tRNA(Tyr) deacylase